jgi:UDP-N-acetylglucosamine 3-dehydrogenase
MGRNHARIYSQLDEVKLVGVADSDAALVESIAHSYNSTPYVNYQQLLQEKLDAVSIVVPTTLHKEAALAAIEQGSNILVEKPIADTMANARDIIIAARKRGTRLMVGHIERFNPAIIKLKQIISDGLLGDIISISARRVGPYNPRIRDVGIILDLGTHDIDIMSYLSGDKVKQVYASAGSVVHSHEDHAIITLNFTGGVSGMIETNWLTPHRVRTLTVIGSQGIAEVDYIQSTLRIFDSEWSREAKINRQEPLKLELEHFIECVRQDKPPLVSGDDGVHALNVALAAIESSRTGKACRVS